MKTAIYIEDGTVQLVLTPDNKFEKDAISTLIDKSLSVKLFEGEFYDCRGGWIRHAKHCSDPLMNNAADKSLMIRVDEVKE